MNKQTKNSSNVPFDTNFIRFKIVDKKVQTHDYSENGTRCGAQIQRSDRDCREKHSPNGVCSAKVHHPRRQVAGGTLGKERWWGRTSINYTCK